MQPKRSHGYTQHEFDRMCLETSAWDELHRPRLGSAVPGTSGNQDPHTVRLSVSGLPGMASDEILASGQRAREAGIRACG